ncbi:hypothetical protein CDAR_66001 [Caerostris darwini]|uniref:Uncharacterized protein n=1 Tax=Caerostris darwini TaxID=1538125 RepID=A0AAV4UC53_9ARAC|nr:hypothetical protein CDAR_66001 [Caerostris darwini]
MWREVVKPFPKQISRKGSSSQNSKAEHSITAESTLEDHIYNLSNQHRLKYNNTYSLKSSPELAEENSSLSEILSELLTSLKILQTASSPIDKFAILLEALCSCKVMRMNSSSRSPYFK